MNAHTPTPWETDITWHRIDNHKGIPILKNGNIIAKAILFDSASVPRAESIANAKRIVHCVNTHDEMIEALKQCQDYLQRNEHFLPEAPDKEEIASIVMEALSNAQGKEDKTFGITKLNKEG